LGTCRFINLENKAWWFTLSMPWTHL